MNTMHLKSIRLFLASAAAIATLEIATVGAETVPTIPQGDNLANANNAQATPIQLDLAGTVASDNPEAGVLTSREFEQDLDRQAAALDAKFLDLSADSTRLLSQAESDSLIGQEGVIDEVQEEVEQVNPGRATRSSPSYIGLGINIGLGDGDSNLGDTSFYLFSKLGLLPYLSVRPALAIEDSVTILLPITYDFRFTATDPSEAATEFLGVAVNPYVGLGPAINTEDEVNLDLVLTGGLDIPFTTDFTGNASISATVIDEPAVGLQLGVGYNFR
ncbi:MAG: hypothetical protein HC890_16520 [Chloroflexaceae bacterium]|nr:hypothetical protein [Chloroflexaceae bacterium]